MATSARYRPSVAQALAVLGGRVETRQGGTWTPAQLGEWLGVRRGAPRSLLCEAIREAGFAAPLPIDPASNVRTGRAKPAAPVQWALTATGQEAARAAAQAAAGAKRAAQRRRRVVVDDALGLRLWRLLRIRRALTAPEAAACLVDAGGNVDQAERAAVQHLARWHRLAPDTVAVAARRIEGARRYVLARDIGPLPPGLAPEQNGGAA